MKLVVLTYDAPHRKTEDVAWRLMAAGYITNMVLLATPWVERKARRYIYPHRPAEPPWPTQPCLHPGIWAKNVGIPYQVAQPDALASCLAGHNPDCVVVGGAGLLSKQVVDEFKVLNVHPGILPYCRGLDALKWAIMDAKPVGVTAHIVNDKADLGWRIMERPVPVYWNDTFHLFALRQYEMELDLLVPALDLALSQDRASFNLVPEDGTESTRRMPRRTEAGLLEAFERYKRIYA